MRIHLSQFFKSTFYTWNIGITHVFHALIFAIPEEAVLTRGR